VDFSGALLMAKKANKLEPHLRVRLNGKLLARLEKARAANESTMTGEIERRLEESYTKDERIEELRGRLDEMRESLAASRAEYEKDRNHLDAEIAERRREIDKLRADVAAEISKFQEEIKALEAEASRLQAAEAIFDALIGEDIASREAIRHMALTMAATPGWATSRDGIQKITEAASATIHAAAKKRAALTAAPLTGTVTATLPVSGASITSSQTSVVLVTGHASKDDRTVDPEGSEENERPHPTAR
jgi:acetyl/propionyl-CoA carboxylase alpha subunit